ncbi:MAG TPA: adenylate/guanylate cyclase domain-containing protein [bacterium]
MGSDDAPGGEVERLNAAIAAQEAQRALLGDAVVDLTISTLRARVAALRQGAAAPPVVGPQPPDLSAWAHRHIPPALAEKLGGLGRIGEERRQVTVVFADITGFTALCEGRDQEEVAAFTDAVLRELSAPVYHYEGYVDKFIGDAVMAVFGAPLAHEDDAERALRAALEMRRTMAGLDHQWRGRLGRELELHVGVNTGEVIAGFSGLQMSYRVVGDTVNTAARLGEAAPPGTIYVSRDTYRLARDAFSFLAMEPIQVKGKTRPLVVYELEQARLDHRKTRGLTDLTPVFVGREAELRELERIAVDLGAGHGRLVAVTGEAGIGKSRLMDEWHDRLRRGGSVNWIEGRCLPFTAALAYGPFLDLLRRYAGIDEEQNEGAVRRRLDSAVGRFFPGDAEARAVFANLMGLGLADEERTLLAGIPAKGLRDRLFALVEEIFTTLAMDCPTVLVIEDLHWADVASHELLEHLFPLAQRLPLAITLVGRPVAGGSPAVVAARERYATHFTDLALAPLTEAGAAEMASRLLSLEEIPEELRDLVVRRAEGNPFYVEETIRSLIEQGALVRPGDGRWKIGAAIGRVVVPDTLHGLLMSRLDRLPTGTRQLAQRASVIGRIFLYRVLHRMTDEDGGIDEGLGQMEREDLIRKRASDPELEYMFRHALTQEVAYASLLAPRRAELHRRVGEVMEELFAGRIGEFTRIIGEHFLKGEAWGRAADYLVRSGDAAARLFAQAEARADYGHALLALERLPGDPEVAGRRVDTTVSLAKANYMGMPPRELLERLKTAEDLAGSLPAPDASPGGDRLRLARVHYCTGTQLVFANRMSEAIAYHSKVLAVAAELQAPELLDMPSFSIGSALVLQGHLGRGRQLLGQAIAAFERDGDSLLHGRARSMLGYAMLHMGDLAGARAEEERAIEILQTISASGPVATAHLILSGLSVYQDHGPAARERSDAHANRAIEVSLSTGDMVLHYFSRGIWAWDLALGGRFSEAAEQMERCFALAAKLGEQLIYMDQFLARRADIALGLGRRKEARAFAEKAVEVSSKTGGIWAEAHAGRALARILATDAPPDFDGAEAYLTRSLGLYESGQNLMGMAHVQIDWGRICRLRGDESAAREHYGEAIALFESKGIGRRAAQVRALMES